MRIYWGPLVHLSFPNEPTVPSIKPINKFEHFNKIPWRLDHLIASSATSTIQYPKQKELDLSSLIDAGRNDHVRCRIYTSTIYMFLLSTDNYDKWGPIRYTLGKNTHRGLERTSMRADSGDNGFPPSQTTKSETSSTTPGHREPSPLKMNYNY